MKAALRRLLREPLVHFLAAGGLIYLGYALWGRHEDDAHRIVVDRAALLQYLQYQAKAFEPGTFTRQLAAMSPVERQQLIDQYVREEVLYREARALGLERGDNVMRLRLVQKMGFLLESSSDEQPTDAQLQDYLRQHADVYTVPPAWTFTHVFIDPAVRGAAKAADDARRILGVLNARHAGFNDAPRYTDRFAYLQNYVERTPDYIASQFGAQFLQALQQLPVGTGMWQGPLRSDQGWHLVLITAREPGRLPAVAEIRDRVADDWRRDRDAARQEQAVQALIRQYHIELLDVPGKATP
ncbi:MAG TPA: peptidylprolyl isomerase [Steroidobacteraceae bacterium]|nr:peptidylprolyl isomerase [Steroidobacteraceae bacterium]